MSYKKKEVEQSRARDRHAKTSASINEKKKMKQAKRGKRKFQSSRFGFFMCVTEEKRKMGDCDEESFKQRAKKR